MPDIAKHHYYSNGAYGRSWGVRMVTEISDDPVTGQAQVTFKGVAGICRRKTATLALDEFERWAKYEVALNENSWHRVSE
jgi:hypothetical protein